MINKKIMRLLFLLSFVFIGIAILATILQIYFNISISKDGTFSGTGDAFPFIVYDIIELSPIFLIIGCILLYLRDCFNENDNKLIKINILFFISTGIFFIGAFLKDTSIMALAVSGYLFGNSVYMDNDNQLIRDQQYIDIINRLDIIDKSLNYIREQRVVNLNEIFTNNNNIPQPYPLIDCGVSINVVTSPNQISAPEGSFQWIKEHLLTIILVLYGFFISIYTLFLTPITLTSEEQSWRALWAFGLALLIVITLMGGFIVINMHKKKNI